MAVSKGYVLLLKSEKPDDLYIKALSSVGFRGHCVPVLSFEFLQLSHLAEKLQCPHHHAGIILTSPRAAQAVEKAFMLLGEEEKKAMMTSWKVKPCYVVGNATGQDARRLGFTVCGEDSGSAANLLPLIIQESSSKTLPLLFPCGNLRRETIPTALEEKGIALNSLTVYETAADPNIKHNLKQLQSEQCHGVPEYIVFYSPSGVQFTQPILEDLDWPCNEIKMIAIGPTTQDAMVKQGLKVASMAACPNPHEVCQAIQTIQ